MSEHLDRQDRLPERRGASASDGGRAHVLIVDDHGPSRDIYAGYCDLFDHTSCAVDGGAAAVAALRRERFDVVVMNVHMRADALETLRAIRALPGPASATPVIGLTAVGRGDEAQRWLGAGLAGVLPKPLTAARLFATLTSLGEADAGARSWAAPR